jgi:hypothetical protein
MKNSAHTTMIIKYPNGTTQTVKPNMQFFQGDWPTLAKAIAGSWYRDNRGEVCNVPYELR